MTITEQAILIRDTLQEWAGEHEKAGKAFIASSMTQLWEQAYQDTESLRCIVVYGGERIRGEFGIAAIQGRVDREWLVAVCRGRGFPAERQDTLVSTVQNAPPLFELLNEAVDLVRSLLVDPNSCERPIDFKGVRPMQTNNSANWDGYLIEFSIGTQRPMLTDEPGDTAAITTQEGTF